MRTLSIFAIIFLCTITLAAETPQQAPIVVELYTSEGCSSCPPADRLLGELERQATIDGAQIIPLGLHVDYWNHIGWTDRFSSPQFSKRQEHYVAGFQDRSVYTPQMVVDGRAFFVGNDTQTAQRVIRNAAHQPKSATVNLQLTSAGALSIDIANSAANPSEVWLAITETNLTTSIRSGENGGRTLTHAAVVRQLKSLGLAGSANFSRTIALPLAKDWKPGNLRAVVFVQRPDSNHIIGAASIPFTCARPDCKAPLHARSTR